MSELADILSREAVEAAAKAMWGDEDWEAAGRCYPWNIDMDDCLQATLNVEVGILAFLAAEGAKVEPEETSVVRPDRIRGRIVTKWAPVVGLSPSGPGR